LASGACFVRGDLFADRALSLLARFAGRRKKSPDRAASAWKALSVFRFCPAAMPLSAWAQTLSRRALRLLSGQAREQVLSSGQDTPKVSSTASQGLTRRSTPASSFRVECPARQSSPPLEDGRSDRARTARQRNAPAFFPWATPIPREPRKPPLLRPPLCSGPTRPACGRSPVGCRANLPLSQRLPSRRR